MKELNPDFELCKCHTCKNYNKGDCPIYKDIKIWIKPNTGLFNYNVDFRGCFINK